MAKPSIDQAFLTPLYSQSEVAQIIRATPSTVQRWTTGYSDGSTQRAPLVTGVDRGRGFTVPFIGLTEAFVINAFRKAGLPMQRIRPAVEALQRELGLEYALASNRLRTDGVEVLLHSDDELDRRLIVVRNGQAAFSEVVDQYLKSIDFGTLYAERLRLPQYPGLNVTVQPTINGGQPTLADRGIAVADVLGRIRSGESPTDVAIDYGVAHDDVLFLNQLAA